MSYADTIISLPTYTREPNRLISVKIYRFQIADKIRSDKMRRIELLSYLYILSDRSFGKFHVCREPKRLEHLFLVNLIQDFRANSGKRSFIHFLRIYKNADQSEQKFR